MSTQEFEPLKSRIENNNDLKKVTKKLDLKVTAAGSVKSVAVRTQSHSLFHFTSSHVYPGFGKIGVAISSRSKIILADQTMAMST